jgi:hypothetical protein
MPTALSSAPALLSRTKPWLLVGFVALLAALVLGQSLGKNTSTPTGAAATTAETGSATTPSPLPVTTTSAALATSSVQANAAAAGVKADDPADDSAANAQDAAPDDPYEVRGFISPPADEGMVTSSTEHIETAAEDSPSEPTDQSVEASSSKTTAVESAEHDLAKESAQHTRAEEGASAAPSLIHLHCPSGSSAAQPVAWKDLDENTRRALPSLPISIRYASQGVKTGFLMIGKRLVREGETLPTGVRLLKVREQSALVSMDDCFLELPLEQPQYRRLSTQDQQQPSPLSRGG